MAEHAVKAVKEVYNIIQLKDGSSKWIRVGKAFVNRDGSINALLDTFPSEGKLQIRDPRRRPAETETERDA